jgi:hypothetical protein
MKKLVTTLLFFIAAFAFAQKHIEPWHVKAKETAIISFKTNDNKFVTVAKANDGTYVVFRMGTKDHVEFEFPKDKTPESLQVFKYAFFLRGGGPENEGMDINHLYFEDDQNKYVVFDTFYASTDSHRIGVTITSKSNPDDVKDIKGVVKNEFGALSDFRTNKLVSVTEEY